MIFPWLLLGFPPTDVGLGWFGATEWLPAVRQTRPPALGDAGILSCLCQCDVISLFPSIIMFVTSTFFPCVILDVLPTLSTTLYLLLVCQWFDTWRYLLSCLLLFSLCYPGCAVITLSVGLVLVEACLSVGPCFLSCLTKSHPASLGLVSSQYTVFPCNISILFC